MFLIADNMAMLLLARTMHGAAVGSIVVAGAAALLDLRPDHGVRSGQLSGVSFNIGMTVAIIGSALLAQYAPHPLRTPYAVVAVICLIVGVGLLALREPHTARSRGPIRIARPAVPRGDPRRLLVRRARRHGVLVGARRAAVAVSVAGRPARPTSTTWSSAAPSSAPPPSPPRWRSSSPPGCPPGARRSSATSAWRSRCSLTIPRSADATSGSWCSSAAALLGATFGLGFGGSLRHLSDVVPADRRGETMSAYYLLAYTAMAVPTLVAGWAATTLGPAPRCSRGSPALSPRPAWRAAAVGMRSTRAAARRLAGAAPL